jgi:carboxyl-terminal processing protease
MRREIVFLLLMACSGTSGMPGSIGVVAKRESSTGRIVVVDAPPGSAGALAGLEKGDEIISVDDHPVYKMSRQEFSAAVRGPVGSKVVVEIVRNGVQQKIVVERLEMRDITPK